MAGGEWGHVPCYGAQPFNKAHPHCVVVIHAKLQTRRAVEYTLGVDRLLHHLAVPARRVGRDHRLRQISKQGLEPRAVRGGQGVPNHHQKGKIGIRLRAQWRQGDRLKCGKAFLHACGRIEVGHPILNRCMFDLKAAQCGVGKST